MEIQDRAVLATRHLSALWGRRWAALALATVVAVSALVVDAQPLRSPWWTYADADASYSASALNLMLGRDVSFVDHPGLPLTETMGIAFAVEALVEEGSLSENARLAFVDRTLLDLDSARVTFRGFAIACYVGGALLAFLLAARLFGHWTWGLALGLLWIAAPGLVPMSIQLRPDVPLAVLTLVFAFTIARAVERRSPAWLAAAAAVAGFATMVKLHALALLPALALAALWRRPIDGEIRALPARVRAAVRGHPVAAAAIAVVWLGAAVPINVFRFPFTPTDGQLALLTIALVLLGVTFAAAAFSAFARLVALVFGGFALGILLPVTVSIPEGLRSLVYVARNVSGQGVQEGVDSFSTPFSTLPDIVGVPVAIVFGAAALAGVLGVLRRDAAPTIWAVAALTMGVMAFARPPAVHYFAPSFVLAAFGLLWLLQRGPRARASLLVWPVVLYVAMPAWDTRNGPAAEQEQFAALVAPARPYVEARLRPGEVAIVPSNWPFADSRFFELVEIYVEHTPMYSYRYLPATAAVRPFAAVRQLRPRFFVGPQARDVTVGQRVQLGDLGEFTLVPAAGDKLVAEIVQGPGVTESW